MTITYGDKIRAKLDKKIFQSSAFDPKSIIISRYSSPSYNEEDEIISNPATVATTVGVPYSLIQGRYNPQAWGKVTEGDGQLAVRYNTDIQTEDIVSIESVNYKVVDIDKNYLPDSVVIICTLSRIVG